MRAVAFRHSLNRLRPRAFAVLRNSLSRVASGTLRCDHKLKIGASHTISWRRSAGQRFAPGVKTRILVSGDIQQDEAGRECATEVRADLDVVVAGGRQQPDHRRTPARMGPHWRLSLSCSARSRMRRTAARAASRLWTGRAATKGGRGPRRATTPMRFKAIELRVNPRRTTSISSKHPPIGLKRARGKIAGPSEAPG